jgi:dolichyl-phosphate beta-glucosyltransferase
MLGSTLVDNLWVAFMILTTALLAAGTAYVFYPALTANPCVARNDGLQVLQRTSSSRQAGEEEEEQRRRPLLSVIVPAYNEELRLVIMLQEAYEYLSSTGTTATGDERIATATETTTCRALQLLQAATAAAAADESNIAANTTTDSTKTVTVEWILVNDGSTDETCRVYRDWVQQLPAETATRVDHVFSLLSLSPNAGKGAAVQAGMLAATGDYRLMVDADGATQFGSGLLALASALVVKKNSGTSSTNADGTTTSAPRPEFLLGSRADLDDTTTDSKQQPPQNTVQRSVIRQALQHLFRYFCVKLIGAGDIRDTQCGFKLLTYQAAETLFRNLHLKRWAFDTEIVFLAARMGCKMKEVAVVWTEVDGSKLDTGGPFGLAMVAISMLRDMICVRLCYSLGIWKVVAPSTAASSASPNKSKSA